MKPLLGLIVVLGLCEAQNFYEAVPIGSPVARPPAPPRPEIVQNFARGYQPPPRPSHFQPPRSYQQGQPVPGSFNPNPSFRAPSLNLDQRPRNFQNPSNWQMQQLQQQHPQRFQSRPPVAVPAVPVPAVPQNHQVPRFHSTPHIRIPTSSIRSNRPSQVEVSPAIVENGKLDPVNNIIIHLYLNAKDKMSHTEIKTPVRGLFGIGTSHGGPGTHSDPIVITRDFDRDTLEFVNTDKADKMMQDGPANIIEVKATVSTPNRQLENTVNKAVNQELDKAIPKVMDRMRGSTVKLDNGMRKELEEALVDELAKNLGESIDNTDVTEEDLSRLIEEGFNEIVDETSTSRATTTTTQRPRVVVTTTTERWTEPPTTRPTTTTTTQRLTTTTRWTPPSTTTRWSEPPTTRSTTEQWTEPPTTTTTTTQRPTTQRWTPPPPTTTTTRATTTTHADNNLEDSEEYTDESNDDYVSVEFPSTTTSTLRTIVITSPTTIRTTTTTTRPTTSTSTVRPTTRYYTQEEVSSTYGGHVHVVPGFRVTETPSTTTTTTARPTTTTAQSITTTQPPPTRPPTIVPYLPSRQPSIEVSPAIVPHRGVVSLESGEEAESTSGTVTSNVIGIYSTTPRSTGLHNLPTKPPSEGTLHPSTFSPPLVNSESTSTTELATVVYTTETVGTTSTGAQSTSQSQNTVISTAGSPSTTVVTTTVPTTEPITNPTTNEEPFDLTSFYTETTYGMTEPIEVEPHNKYTEEPFSTKSLEWNPTTQEEEEEEVSPFSTFSLDRDLETTTASMSTIAPTPSPTVTIKLPSEPTVTIKPPPAPVFIGDTSNEEYDYVVTNEEPHLTSTSTLSFREDVITVSTSAPLPVTVTNPRLIKPKLKESSSEEIQPTMILQNGPCSTPNQQWDQNHTDVLFLLDSSDSFNEQKFQSAIQLIGDTVSQFNNFGPDGLQVSLVQYNDEPYLEFSLRKHNCKKHLLDDISNTEYMTGGSQLGKALEKVSQFAFTKKRGDRPDAENILVIVTDGQSNDQVQQPMRLAKENNVTVLVISTIGADKEYIDQLADHRFDNQFGLEDAPNQQLSWKLAKRIADVSGKPTNRPPLSPVVPPQGSDIENKIGNGVTEIPMTHHFNRGSSTSRNEQNNGIVKLECVAEGFKILVTPPAGFHGVAVVKGYQDDAKCKATATSEGEVNIFIANTECGVTQLKSSEPKGLNSSLVLHLLHDKELNTGEDRAYLLQCFIGTPEDTELSTNLDVVRSELTIAETISLSTLPPSCTYSIRKDHPDGPIVTKAVVGQTVYHKWECDGSNETSNAYGIQIHTCFASDDVERKFAFVDPHGCSSDLALLSDLTYSDDSLSAHAASHVFSVHNAESLKFVCKLSLCTRDGDGCEGVTPPSCGNTNQSDILLTRRLVRNQNAVDEALTSALSTRVGLSGSTSDGVQSVLSSLASNYVFWVVAAVAVSAIVGVSIFARNSSSSETTTTCSDPSSVSDTQHAAQRPDLSSVDGSSMHSGNVQPNERLAEFMRSFDRSQYV